jgi:hypothetical protein
MSPLTKPNRIVVALLVATAATGALVVWLLAGRHGSPPPEAAARESARAPARPPSDRPFAPERHERAAQAVREAVQTSPERLSSTAALPPFDKAAFERDPQHYLAQVEPARCFQTAEPGASVPPLEIQSAARAELPEGGELPLSVKSTPGAPVTFTAFDGGKFKQNGLTSVTVRADARGLAIAHFTATRGIGGDVNIVAGSPLAAGVQRFLLRVSP